MNDEIVTNDLKEFGYRELNMAAALLKAYANGGNTVSFSDKVSLYMNRSSGYVFLSDDEGKCGMIEDGHIVEFYNCPQCGNEGTAADGLYEGWDFERYEPYCSKKCLDKNR